MKAKNVRPFDQVKMIGANLSSLVMFNESQKLKPDQDLKTCLLYTSDAADE